MLMSFVKLGMGVSLIDPFTVMYDASGGFETRPFRPPVMLDIAIVTAKSRPLSVIGQEFLQVVRSGMEEDQLERRR